MFIEFRMSDVPKEPHRGGMLIESRRMGHVCETPLVQHYGNKKAFKYLFHNTLSKNTNP